MAKVIDITDKLDFEGNPRIKIKNTEYEVQADAATVLKIMGIIGDNKEPSPKEIAKICELIFQESDRKKIEKLKFKDYQVLVFTAMSLIIGEESQGE